MLKYIWSFLILFGFTIGLINGRINEVSKAFMEGSSSAITIIIGLAGIMCFWSGIMEIAKGSGVTNLIGKISRPVLRIIFPEIPKNHPAESAIIMNISANILGLGNAATPFGLKAMEELNNLNDKDSTCSNSMIMFLVLNTSMIQLLPTTVVALRTSLGSANPSDVSVSIWITSILGTISGIIIVKVWSSVRDA